MLQLILSCILQVVIALTSSVTGPAVALLILGAVSKHANWKVGIFSIFRNGKVSCNGDDADDNGYDECDVM